LAKRAFDLAAALLGVVVLSPLLLATALLVKFDSPGPVFFRGLRAGRHRRPFRIFKFRTMVAGAGARGAGITTSGDPRITRAGRWLRRTKLDELPQLFNVLAGDMSIVGPRPEDPRYLAYYRPEHEALFAVRPGLTGPASIAFRDEEELLQGDEWEARYVTVILPAKLDLELDYLWHRSFAGDVRLVVQTFFALWNRGSRDRRLELSHS
jgi:lipopolysaccharide/colanic/teichoic acid biosynthesis glycosyltransferase